MALEKVNKATRSFGCHRFVIGPQNEIGYITKKPGHGAATELILLKREKNREKERKLAQMKADSRRALQRNDAEEKWALMDMRSAVDRIVNLGLRRADEELDEKRNRLKIALLKEEAALMYEYTGEAQKATEKILSKNKQKVEGILRQKVLADKAFNEAIKQKIALNTSETYAEHVRVQNLKNAVEANRAQIRANEYQKAVEKDGERLWEKIDRERTEATAKETRAVSKLRRKRQQIYKESLDQQVKSGGIFRTAEILSNDFENKMQDKLQAENARNLRQRYEQAEQRRRQHFEDSKKHKDEVKSHRLKNETENLKYEEMLVEDAHRKFLLDESKQVSQKEQLKHELMSFQSSIQNYKQMDEKLDEDFDRIVTEETGKLRADQISKLNCKKIARKKRMVEILSLNKRQAAEKLKQESAARELDQIYHEFQLREGDILNKVDEMLQIEYRKNYETAPTNLENLNYSRKLKLRQLLIENEDDCQIATDTSEMEATVRDKLAKRIDDYSAKHPFYEKLKKCEK